jgi:hypothetical protein
MSEVIAASIFIALMMEAAGTSKTSVNFYQTTQCYNPEDKHLLSHIGQAVSWLTRVQQVSELMVRV